MEIIILLITFICLILSIIKTRQINVKPINVESFNAANKLPTTNTVSQTSRTLADHNSIINNINLEPSHIIEDGNTSFMVSDSFNDKNFPDMKNNIDNLTYNAVKDILFEVKKLLNDGKTHICFNESKISNINVPLEKYERILKYIFDLVSQICSNSFKIQIASVEYLHTYVDINDVYYVNFNLTTTIVHPMDEKYGKKELNVPINLTIIIDFNEKESIDKNTQIFIKDFNVIH